MKALNDVNAGQSERARNRSFFLAEISVESMGTAFYSPVNTLSASCRSFSEASSRAKGSLVVSAWIAVSSRLNLSAVGERTMMVPVLVALLDGAEMGDA